jgi:hypothetical protein
MRRNVLMLSLCVMAISLTMPAWAEMPWVLWHRTQESDSTKSSKPAHWSLIAAFPSWEFCGDGQAQRWNARNRYFTELHEPPVDIERWPSKRLAVRRGDRVWHEDFVCLPAVVDVRSIDGLEP